CEPEPRFLARYIFRSGLKTIRLELLSYESSPSPIRRKLVPNENPSLSSSSAPLSPLGPPSPTTASRRRRRPPPVPATGSSAAALRSGIHAASSSIGWLI
ncbi:hypothetical protein EJB05_41388, partial [Eragrostis curvula]